MKLVKRLHKEVRNNWWFINRIPLVLIWSSILIFILVLNVSLELLEKLSN
jgi:hypothetical protein